MGDTPKLGQFPGEFVHVECRKCERSGRYRTANLIAKHGPNFTFLELRATFQKTCDRSNDVQRLNEACGVSFPDLVPWLLGGKPKRS
jgi:hypothetical protein